MSQGAVAEKAAEKTAEKIPVHTAAPPPPKRKWPRQFWPVAYLPEYDLPLEMAWMGFILPGRPNDDGIFDLFVLNPGGQWTKRQSVQPKSSELFVKFPENKANGCWDWAPAWSREMMEFMDALAGGVPSSSEPEPFDQEGFLAALEDPEFRKRIAGVLKEK